MAEMTDQERLTWAADKITALLAKAESTTPDEAEALTDVAVRLMAKYKIDQSLLDMRRAAAGQTSESIIKHTFKFTGTYHRALLYTFEGVAKQLGLQASFHRYPNASYLHIYGFESDVAQAKLLMTSLQLQLTSALTAWWRTYDEKRWMSAMAKFKSRRSFMFAFGEGVEYRLFSARRTAMAEAESTAPGTEVALLDRAAQLRAHYKTLGVETVKIRQDITDLEAHVAGYESGVSADTGENKIVNKRRAITSSEEA